MMPRTILSTYTYFLRDSKSVAKSALDLALAGSSSEDQRDRDDR